MKKTFIMRRSEVVAADGTLLRDDIVTAAGSEGGAASIIRSLERLGTDESIEFYEMTQVTNKRAYSGELSMAWRVRADRGQPVE